METSHFRRVLFEKQPFRTADRATARGFAPSLSHAAKWELPSFLHRNMAWSVLWSARQFSNSAATKQSSIQHYTVISGL